VWAEWRDFIYKNSVRTSQETHYVSATETSRLMLFGETVAVYCENHTEHTNTLRGQNSELNNIKSGGIYNYLSVLTVKIVLCYAISVKIMYNFVY
jgi:hypothetical protein